MNQFNALGSFDSFFTVLESELRDHGLVGDSYSALNVGKLITDKTSLIQFVKQYNGTGTLDDKDQLASLFSVLSDEPKVVDPDIVAPWVTADEKRNDFVSRMICSTTIQKAIRQEIFKDTVDILGKLSVFDGSYQVKGDDDVSTMARMFSKKWTDRLKSVMDDGEKYIKRRDEIVQNRAENFIDFLNSAVSKYDTLYKTDIHNQNVSPNAYFFNRIVDFNVANVGVACSNVVQDLVANFFRLRANDRGVNDQGAYAQKIGSIIQGYSNAGGSDIDGIKYLMAALDRLFDEVKDTVESYDEPVETNDDASASDQDDETEGHDGEDESDGEEGEESDGDEDEDESLNDPDASEVDSVARALINAAASVGDDESDEDIKLINRERRHSMMYVRSPIRVERGIYEYSQEFLVHLYNIKHIGFNNVK